MANPPGTIGNDFFISTADPFDLINGLSGVDTVSYALATSGVSVSFIGYPEVIVGWNFGYHSYLLAAGV